MTAHPVTPPTPLEPFWRSVEAHLKTVQGLRFNWEGQGIRIRWSGRTWLVTVVATENQRFFRKTVHGWEIRWGNGRDKGAPFEDVRQGLQVIHDLLWPSS